MEHATFPFLLQPYKHARPNDSPPFFTALTYFSPWSWISIKLKGKSSEMLLSLLNSQISPWFYSPILENISRESCCASSNVTKPLGLSLLSLPASLNIISYRPLKSYVVSWETAFLGQKQAWQAHVLSISLLLWPRKCRTTDVYACLSRDGKT